MVEELLEFFFSVAVVSFFLSFLDLVVVVVVVVAVGLLGGMSFDLLEAVEFGALDLGFSCSTTLDLSVEAPCSNICCKVPWNFKSLKCCLVAFLSLENDT